MNNRALYGSDADGDFLVPNRTEQATVAHLVELRQEGLGYHKVAAILTEEGRPTKRGAPWPGHDREEHLSALLRILPGSAVPAPSRIPEAQIALRDLQRNRCWICDADDPTCFDVTTVTNGDEKGHQIVYVTCASAARGQWPCWSTI